MSEKISHSEIEAVIKDRDHLLKKLDNMREVIAEATNDPETVLSYKTLKAFQSCLSEWPKLIRDGQAQNLAHGDIVVCIESTFDGGAPILAGHTYEIDRIRYDDGIETDDVYLIGRDLSYNRRRFRLADEFEKAEHRAKLS